MDLTKTKVGLADIAKALGTSIGTVDRALNNRAGVNPMTRAKVVQMARTLGYRPNLAARALASKRKLRIAAVLPRDSFGFFGDVGEGILEAGRLLESTGVTVEVRECPWLKEGEARAMEQAIEDGVNGLIIAPGNPESVRAAIRKASRVNIPVVCVSTDAPSTERLTVVRAEPAISGSMAAELIGGVLGGKGRVALITGSVLTTTHVKILEGFRKTLADYFPRTRFVAAVESHDDEEEAYRKALELFGAGEAISGLFVSTSNSPPILRALDVLGLTGNVVVVTMDLFPALAARIRDGAVFASIYQRPRNQGRQSFSALYHFLTEGICPPARIGFAPHIILRSNLELFLPKGETQTDTGPVEEGTS